MKLVTVHPKVDMARCEGCKTCELVCPTYAISVRKEKGEVSVDVNEDRCVGCWNCEQRCPEHAIAMVPCEPRELFTDVSRFDRAEVDALCRKAHFHPKQVVCYCTGSRAEELAAAILGGAHTPDAIVLATGINAGCGIECNQPVVRFLEAAGFSYERRKQSYQWYGRTMTAWEVPEAVKSNHASFRFEEDRELLDKIVRSGSES